MLSQTWDGKEILKIYQKTLKQFEEVYKWEQLKLYYILLLEIIHGML